MAGSMAGSKKEQIRALLKSIETGDSESVVSVVNEAKYIQHNPQTHEGSEGLALLFKRLSKTGPRVNMARGFEDGEFVFAQMEYDFSSSKICFEVFRFDEGKAVEHWDNIQERSPVPNQSGRSMVDGPTEATDLERTEQNRALVRSFVETCLIGGQMHRLTEFIDEEAYCEHNPDMSDGVEALARSLQRSLEGKEGEEGSKRAIAYHRLHRVLAEGNFVLSVSEGEKDGAHSSFYDLFRVAPEQEGGKVVEHWDTTEKVVPRSEWKNDNGKF